MKYLSFILHSEKYCEMAPPPALSMATEFLNLHRKHWPGFEGEHEVTENPNQQPRQTKGRHLCE
jgi:hypothetical protein